MGCDHTIEPLEPLEPLEVVAATTPGSCSGGARQAPAPQRSRLCASAVARAARPLYAPQPMWTQAQVHAEVRGVLLEYAEVDDFDPGDELVGDLGLDTLDLMTVVGAMEDRFGLRFADEQLARASTVRDVSRLVVDLLARAGKLAA